MHSLDRKIYTNVAVITPTFNRPDSVIRTAESILADSNSSITYIVVDQDRSGETRRAFRESGLSRDPRFTYLFSDIAGESRARNIGMRHALRQFDQTVLVGIDDDCIATDRFASRYLELFNRTGSDMHFASMMRPENVEGLVPVFTPEERTVIHIDEDATTKLGMSGNFAITSELFRKVGPFDELLGSGSRIGAGDDLDYAIRAARLGALITTGPEPEVVHYGARIGADDRELRMRYIRGFVALAKKHHMYDDPLLEKELTALAKRSVLEVAQSIISLKRPSGLSTLAAIAEGIWMMRQYEKNPETDHRILKEKV